MITIKYTEGSFSCLNNKLNPKIWFVLSNLLVVFLGIGLIVPVMPTIMREMGLDGKRWAILLPLFH